MAARLSARLAGLLVIAVTATGCVQIPNEGPVLESTRAPSPERSGGTVYTPPRPFAGATQREIVLGFLEAMKATPTTTTPAAEFLSQSGRSQWRPQEATITYRGLTAPEESSDVRLWASGGQRYDRNGVWEGALGANESRLSFTMVKERGQWRIEEAPDAFLVPDVWFRTNFVRSAVHFLEPTGERLVPEPVHVPAGVQQATSLVRTLLAGPDRATEGALRTAVPDGLSLESNAVPVDDDGLATVALQGTGDALGEGVSPALAAQLAWTLRQVPGVRTMTVLLNGEAIPFTSGRAEESVDASAEFAPYGANPERVPFALVNGRLLRGEPGRLTETSGPWGAQTQPVKQLSVSLDGRTAVGISADGTALLSGPVESETGRAQVSTLLTRPGTLGEVAQDAAGRVWALNRSRTGTTVLVVGEGRVQEITTEQTRSGVAISELLVSPDGTRLVLVVRRQGRDEVHASRIVLDPATGDMRAGETRQLSLSLDAGRRVLDLAWVPGQGVAVLSELTDDLSDVQVLTVEGAPFQLVGSDSFRLRPGAKGMAYAVVPGSPRYVYAGQDVRVVDQISTVLDRLPAGVSWFGYPG